MSKEMLLEIVTPQGVIFSKKVTYIKAPGQVGEFGIMSDHIPFYSILKAGVLEYVSESREKISIEEGVLECIQNKITVITKSTKIAT